MARSYALKSILDVVVLDKDALRWMGAMKASPVHRRDCIALEIAKG
jgi:hypothetical protein